jgi:hypothetical protein
LQAIALNLLAQSIWTSWLPLPGTERKPRTPPPAKSTRRRAAKAAPAAATDPATARVERYLAEVTRVSTAQSPAEALKGTSHDQISVVTSLPVGSVDQAIEQLSSCWS